MTLFEVFVSYETSEALPLADVAKERFANARHDAYVWARDKTVGALMFAELAARIDEAALFFYICTSKSGTTWPQRWELNKALYENKPIVGVALDWNHVPSEARPLIGEETSPERYAAFCDHVAQNFDRYVRMTKRTASALDDGAAPIEVLAADDIRGGPAEAASLMKKGESDEPA